jgi:hypothetical protein
VRIRICGTYRCLSQLLTPFSNESRVAPHVVGMVLAIATLVVGARSVLCLLPRISAAGVVRVFSPPLLIEPPLLFLTTLGPTTGLLPLLEPRMGMKPTSTKRTSPPREHTFLLRANILRKGQNRGRRERKRKSKRERLWLFEDDQRKKTKKIRSLQNKPYSESLSYIGRLMRRSDLARIQLQSKTDHFYAGFSQLSHVRPVHPKNLRGV